PDDSGGRLPRLVERLPGDPLGKGLRCDSSTVEMHFVLGIGERLGIDGNAGRFFFRESTGAAVQRNDAVAILVSRFGGVIRPLECLERMFVTTRVFKSGGRSNACKR